MTDWPQSTELPWMEPADALLACANAPWLAFLDSGGPPEGVRARWSFLCSRPRETLLWRDGLLQTGAGGPARRADIQDVLTCARAMHARLRPAGAGDLPPFAGGVIGLASYASGLALEGIVSRHHTDAPAFVAASYEDVLAFDRLEGRLWWVSGQGTPPPAFAVAPDIMSGSGRTWTAPRLSFAPDMDRAAWLIAVERVRAFIEAGDIFQANLTLRWHAELATDCDETALYRVLRHLSPAPFGAYLRTPDFALLSASVERFLFLSAGGHVETRPIKGTAPLGEDIAATRHLADMLARDPKENAENLMITDLMRNDIGRVCQIGSVAVPQLCEVEQFPHLQHLVSCVQGQLRDGLDAFDLLGATLPPGSVTGAPKRRAMDVIDEVEASGRGAYCGSMFRVGRDGAMDSSVVIRSLERAGSRLSLGVGGGITWLSDPAREYEEMRLKAAPLLGLFAS